MRTPTRKADALGKWEPSNPSTGADSVEVARWTLQELEELGRKYAELVAAVQEVSATLPPNVDELTGLLGGGDTALHFHSADRARANHTGTQSSSTIADFAAAVEAHPSVQASAAGRHAAVTVITSATLSLALTGQQLSGEVNLAAVLEAVYQANWYDASGTAAGVMSAHTEDADPHPQYLTPAEADAVYATIGNAAANNVISVPTIIAADTSYMVASYLKVDSDLTINGNLMVTG